MLTLTGNVVIGTIDARAAGCSDEVVIYDSIMILGSSSISASRAYPPHRQRATPSAACFWIYKADAFGRNADEGNVTRQTCWIRPETSKPEGPIAV